MARNRTSDEQALASAFQQLADVLVPLKQELRVRAHAMVGAFLGVASSSDAAPVEAPPATAKPAGRQSAAGGRQSTSTARQSAPPARAASGKAPSPKDFMAEKKANTDTERVACLAYYLTNHRGVQQFKTADVAALNTEAGGVAFGSNGTYAVNNATQAGYLAAVSRGMKQLAPAGEKYVDALPDRAAAKAGFRKRKTKRQRNG